MSIRPVRGAASAVTRRGGEYSLDGVQPVFGLVDDLAIVAALVFGWGTLSTRPELFDVTAPITCVLAGLLLTHGPLAFFKPGQLTHGG